eukprot:5883508-Prymnesium_polylepis.1
MSGGGEGDADAARLGGDVHDWHLLGLEALDELVARIRADAAGEERAGARGRDGLQVLNQRGKDENRAIRVDGLADVGLIEAEAIL